MNHLTVTPAYGRDYKSKKAVEEAFNANKDFVIATFPHPHSGRMVNKQDLDRSESKGWCVHVRYGNLRKTHIIRSG